MKFLISSILCTIMMGTVYGQDWLDESCSIENQVSNEDYSSIKDNNLLTLIIDQEGKLLMNGRKSDGLSEIKFKETVYEFLTNPNKDKTKASSPKQAIIAVGAYGDHDYYDLILRYVREVYLYAWDTTAEEKYDTFYSDLDCKKRKKVRNSGFPYRLLELKTKEDAKKPSFAPGVPSFDGDVIDN